MTAGAPRSARSVDPASREVAEDLARRSGMSLNEWLGRLMADEPEDATSHDYFIQGASARPTGRSEAGVAGQGPRFFAADETRRVTDALERLSDRIESAESRQALAIAGVERSVREVIQRIDAGEREQMQVAARVEGAVEAVQGEQGLLSARLGRIELENQGPRAVEAVRALEGAIGKVAGHAYEAERRARDAIGQVNARVERLDESGRAASGAIAQLGERTERLDHAERATSGAIRELKSACAELDGRLERVEGDAGELVQTIADNLSARVDQVRESLAQQLAVAAETRFERVDQALAEMGEHVRAAEHRSAGALERMGHEVLQVAQNLNTRVQGVEHRSAEAAERIGAQMSRVASAVEDRLARADALQAQALEKLGGEIARITERLADRIAVAERRSAQAIDDVGEQVSRVTERVSQRQERSAGELAERIRLSEERTARLLDEARQKIDDRLAETQRRRSDSEPRLGAPAENDDSLFADAPFPSFGAPPAERPYARAAPAALFTPILRPQGAAPPGFDDAAFDDADFEAAADLGEPGSQAAPPTVAPILHADATDEDDIAAVELEPNQGFDLDEARVEAEPARADRAEAAANPPTAASASIGATFADPAPARVSPPTTREVIERARAAARATGETAPAARRGPAKRAAKEGVLGSLSFGRLRGRPPSAMTGALMVASLLAAVSLSAGGFLFLEGEPGGKLPKRVADALALSRAPGGERTQAAPLAALALSPSPMTPRSAADLAAGYSRAVAKIEASQAGGLADMRRLADDGYAPAQFYFSKLYEAGEHGVKQDPVEARRWVERAAEAGDRAAMHNLALDYFEGTGGAKSAPMAAEWFRRAADLGLLDSQFNLAGLYEHGDGVSQNMAEAYKWYLIAARAGDAESKAAALRLRALLTPQARAVAERAAADFQPAPSGGAAAAAPGPASPDLVTAQRALNQLGYYQGPTDGAASPALKLAIAAYQRDQGLAVTGAPDAATVAKLSVYTQ